MNEVFDGDTDQNLLTGTDLLEVGDKGAILLTVTIAECGSTTDFINFAVVHGTSPGGEMLMDSTVNGSDPDANQNDDPSDDASGTPVTLEEESFLGVAKNVSELPESNDDGTYDMTFEVRVANRGNIVIDSIQVIDDLENVFGDNCQWEVLGLESEEFSVNWSSDPDNRFNGLSDSTLLNADINELNAWDEGAIYIRLRVGPCDMLGMFENVAVGSGVTPGGEMLTDSSQMGSEPDPDGDGDPGNNSDPTPFDLEENPVMGLAKRLVTIEQVDGGYLMTFEFNIENFGDVDIDSIQVVDDLATTFPGPCSFEKVDLTSDAFTVNDDYDGVTDLNMLVGTDMLSVDETGAILLTIKVDDCVSAGPFENIAVIDGVSPTGTEVIDTSTDGANPDPNDDGNPDEAEPTIIVLPGIQLVKEMSTTSPPELQLNGNYKVSFDFTIINSGLDTLENIELYDDFQNQFGCVYQDNIMDLAVTDVDVVASGGLLPGLAGVFTGSIPAHNLLDGTGVLPPGSTFMVMVAVELDPDCSGAPDSLLNQATVEAEDMDGNPVTDMSTDTIDLFGDTPTGVVVPGIGVSKEVVDVSPVDTTDGNFILTYLIRVQNTGNLVLDSVQLEDEIESQLLPALVPGSVMVVPGSLMGQVNTLGGVNATFDGSGPASPGLITSVDILDGTAVLEPGQMLEVRIKLEIDASMIPVEGDENSAVAEGKGPDGENPMDSSEVGINPDGSDENGDSSVNTPTPVPPLPAIGIAKAQTGYMDAGEENDGNVLVTFEFIIKNIGTTPLDNLGLIEDIGANTNLGTAYVGTLNDSTMVTYVQANPDSTGGVPALNGSFTGMGGDINVFDGASGLLYPCDSLLVKMVVEVDPNAEGAPNPLLNTATATGDFRDITVDDESFDGFDPEGGDVPTEILAPAIGLLKQITETQPAASGVVGNFDQTFKFTIYNVGNDTLRMIELVDNINDQYGAPGAPVGPFVAVVIPPMVTNSSAVMDPTVNAGYDGTAADSLILSGADGVMAPGDSVCITLTIEINPNAMVDPDQPLLNSAIARGTDSNGDVVEDVSDSGDGEGGDDPTGAGIGDINLAKDIWSIVPAASGAPGNVDVSFRLILKNKGNVLLTDIQLTDDVNNLMGPAFVGVTTPPFIDYLSAGSTAPAVGGFPATVLNGGGSMEPNDSIIVLYTLEIDPDAVGTPTPLPNVAGVTAQDPTGAFTTDDSDAGLNPESTNPEHPDDLGTEDDTLYVYAPSIGIAKKLVEVRAPELTGYGQLVKPGHFDAIYEITFQNLGNTDLDSVSLIEDLQAMFGAAFVDFVLPELTITSQDASEAFQVNLGYTGVAPNAEMLAQGVGVLQPGQSVSLQLIVEINSNEANGPLANQISGTARGLRPADAPTSPGEPVVNKLGEVITTTDLSDGGTDPGGLNEDDPFDMGTEDDPTILPDCWSEACQPICITAINVPLGPDCELEVSLDMILSSVDELCVELGFYTIEVRDAVGALLPTTTIAQSLAQRNPFFTITASSIICPDEQCWTELTIKDNKKPIISDGFDTTVYCNDPFLLLTADSPLYRKPWVDPACGTNFAEGPLFVADWIDADFPCASPFAKVIYREWEALGPGGERATAFDVIRVMKLPEITASNLICPARDTIYCGETRACVGPKLVVPKLDNPLEFDTLCLDQSVEGLKCGISVHTDLIDFPGDECFKQSKLTVEIKQECYSTQLATILEGMQGGNVEITGGNGEPVYVKCDMWLIELDTTAPILRKDLSKVVKVESDTIYVPTSSEECVAHTYLPPVRVEDCSEIKEVKVRVPGIGNFVYTYDADSAIWEGHEQVKIPLGTTTMIIYEAFDKCHNVGSDTCYVKVKDNTAPVAVCTKGSTVSLTSKKVWVDATNFNEGSSDNCGINLLLARRADWAEACVDLCDDVEVCPLGDHDTIWCPELEEDKDLEPAEAHYAQILEWLQSDGSVCADLVYEAWQYDLCKYATLECFGEYYDEQAFDKLYQEKYPDVYAKYGDELSQMGGGWSDEVPFDCEDACSEVTVELLLVDYWCNWSTCWTKVWVEDKTPIVIGEDVTPEVEITCKTYKENRYELAGEDHPVSLSTIVGRASDDDPVAFAALDSILGSYEKAWKDQYGNLVDANGDPIDSEITYEDSTCVCDKFTREVWTYDEHLGYIKESTEYDSCWYEVEKLDLNHGLVEVNCSEGVLCDQDIWAEFNHCGEGYIFREFKIWRDCTNPEYPTSHIPDTIRRKQRIWVGNECALNVGMFKIPKEVKVDACGLEYDDMGNAAGVVHPDQIGWAEYIFDDDCRLTGVGYSDKVFRIVSGDNACFKIIRTWHLMDWCQLKPDGDELWWLNPEYETQVVSVDQKIIVQDTVAPVCEIAEIGDNGELEIGGCDIDLPVQVRIDELCGISSYEWQLKDEKGDIVKTGDGVVEGAIVESIEFIIEDLGQGDYTLKLIVTDECENEGGCDYDFTVIAAKKPQAICITTLTAKLNPMDLDGDGQIDTAMAVVWASEFNSSSQPACGSTDPLEYRIDLIDGEDDDIFTDDADSLHLTCEHLGTRMIRLWVIDPSGAADYCDVLLVVQDSDGLCEQFGGSTVAVGGVIATEANAAVSQTNVNIMISNGEQFTQLTDGDGAFNTRVPQGETITITPAKDGDDHAGISTSDLILLQKHILGKKLLESEYRERAGDVNDDGRISPADMVSLRKLILGIVDEYPDSDSWRFYGMTQDERTVKLENMQEAEAVDFMALKIGDLNLDYDPARSAARSAEVMPITTMSRQLTAGNSYRIDLRASDLADVEGYQFTLEFNSALVQIDGVEPGEVPGMSEDNFGMTKSGQGYLTTSWHRDDLADDEAVAELLTGDAVLFSVVITALDNVHLSDAMSLNGRITEDEAYSKAKEIRDIALEFTDERLGEEFALYQNRPNPFAGQTVIEFKLPEAMSAMITIYDVNGRVIQTYQGDYAKGFNQLKVSSDVLPTKGMFYYQLDTDRFTATRRMIMIQ